MNQFVTISSPLTRVPYVAPPVYQYDCGLKLKVKHAENLWEQAHFTIVDTNISLKTIAERDEDGAMVMSIPDTLLVQSKKIRCFLYSSTEEYGRTVYEIIIPVNARPEPAGSEYTPEEIAYFDSLVAQLRGLIDQVQDATGDASNLNQSVGDINQLTTKDKSNLVAAVNEVQSAANGVGDIATLTTTAKTNTVAAINELKTKTDGIGDITLLDTSEVSSVVDAINEVKAMADTIGALDALQTKNKLCVVDAINEIKQTTSSEDARLQEKVTELTDAFFGQGDPQPIIISDIGTHIPGHFFNNSDNPQNVRVSVTTYYQAYYFFAEKDGYVKIDTTNIPSTVHMVVAHGVVDVNESSTTFNIECVSHQRYLNSDGTLPTQEFLSVSAGDLIGVSFNNDKTLTLITNLFTVPSKLSESVLSQTTEAAVGPVTDAVINVTDGIYTRDTVSYTSKIVRGTINNNGTDNNSATYASNNIRSDGYVELINPSASIKIERSDDSYGINMWFFDDTYSLIGSVKTGITGDVFAPDGTKYIRYRINNASGITPDDIINVKIYQYTPLGVLKTNNKVKMCAMGDSITEGWYSYIGSNGSGTSASNRAKAWISVFGDIKGFDITNIAIGGTGWVMNPQGKRSARRLAFDTDFSGYDLVTLAYGINDWKGQQSLGSMEDAVLTDEQVAVAEDGTGTIYSNMRYVIEKIIRDNPACKIFIITPLNSWQNGTEETNWGIGYSYANSKTLEDVFAAEKEIAEYYGIELIDMTHNSMINRKNIQKMLLDKVHPSEAAHRIIGYELAGKIHFA